MGLTQQTHGVATIQDAVALLLMRGMIGTPGAGVCPVRGHSNVQGDRTMGIWEKMPEGFLAALDTEFGKATFVVNDLRWVPVPAGRLILQTMRNHDQYNTTIYGLDDRYRGIKNGRRVLQINAADIGALGYTDGDIVDLVSE
ncbi:hypothetical protein GOTRE_023_00260 [Gordonia terrae NBRC 100016]|uniref:Molybdopterin dinucleotide-binding domain-containing protein n=1 Tax=Gordonia terrae NBRC 100016 TaxID=1089454 RepID=A0ABQ0H9Z3_9ACTN|nr:hypothetical protein GOTRE_023_00260 [Gordonia terrae NBRC 100016]VTR11465.1 anaerobic dehydrogenase [Clostridioides difficile]VTS59635.1 Formate dehydrogenase H [Gordonia terrae]